MSKKPQLHLLELKGITVFEQLQIEEALFRLDDRNWMITNFGVCPSIVLGISGHVDRLVNRQKWQADPLPLIRRFSGGGTVVVDEQTLFITFICQEKAVAIPPFPRSIMEWSAALYAPLFPPGRFALCEQDYTLDCLKWGGNAQSIKRGSWLHHSSILWDFDPQKMDYLLMPEKTPAYRQGREHDKFLCRLKDLWQTPHCFQNQLKEVISKQFDLQKISLEEVIEIKDKDHRRSTINLKW